MPSMMIPITSADGSTRAGFIPEANLLCCLFEHRGIELLDPTHGIDAYRDRGATMAIPLLHPWANRLERHGYEAAGKSVTLPVGDPRIPTDPGGLPIHGILPSLLVWEVEQQGEGSLTARLDFDSPELLELFPFPHRLRVRAEVAPGRVTIATVLSPTGADPVPVSFGYHPYLRVPGGGRGGWEIELGAGRRLELDERMIPTGESEPLESRAFRLAQRSLDDGLDGLDAPPVFAAASDQGRITVEFGRGYPYAQVYAPPERDFICFEPMTAPANALCRGEGLTVVEPGTEYSAEFTVAVMLP
jgi:aldose 1-epimerase